VDADCLDGPVGSKPLSPFEPAACRSGRVQKSRNWSRINMADPAGAGKGQRAGVEERRRYDSPLRRERADATRQRILEAGSALAHGFPTWDWRGLSAGAVAERAGVNKATVYRHFPTERMLHDAIMQRLEDEAGISYDGLSLGSINALVERAYAHLSSFAGRPEPEDEAPTVGADQRRREALLRAVTSETPDWPSAERRMTAAVLDVLWSRNTHERLTETWGLGAEQTTEAVTWAIALLTAAVREGRQPGPQDA
jgi:AcrR family transcriptional regulator